MSGVKTCPVCASGNAATSERCWVCGAALSSAPGSAVEVPAPVRDSGDALQAIGWLALLSGIAFVTVLVAVELALEWPGLLIPYALVVLIGFAALARTAWLQSRRSRETPSAPEASAAAPEAPAAPPSSGGSKAGDLARDVALGLSIALIVIAFFALLAVAAVVIFLAICFAVIAGSGGL